MANRLTGDFDAVLQVSNSLLDRLAASMHQNGFPNPTLPSLPHIVHFRIEDREHGSVSAQVGCPHVVLIDGATDRFLLETAFRARFRADPGSPPLADLVNGTIRATYRVHEIDPTCAGWRGIADDYLWLRVIRSSVSFDGVAYHESTHMLLTALADQATVDARLTKHLRALLADGFAPKPHRVGKQFKRFRSLVRGTAPGRSALAFPFALSGGAPAGSLNSLGTLFLDGQDFALAIRSEVIVAAVAPTLDGIAGSERSFQVLGDAGYGGGLIIDYHVRTDAAEVTWHGAAPFGMGFGIARFKVTGRGYSTRIYRSGVYNVGGHVSLADIAMTFTVEQYVSVQFQASGQFVVNALGAPVVNIAYTGPFAAYVTAEGRKRITALVQPLVEGGLASAAQSLRAYAAREKLDGMVEAIKSVDPAASAAFVRASYHPDGLVLHGAVGLAPRWAPRVAFRKTDTGDGFDAIETWIPGGRVDRFEWTWRWYSNPVAVPPGSPGSVMNEDSYQLRRPHRSRSRFGAVIGAESPLPGLDGMGRVCLTIQGARVDHVTGAWVPVRSTTECAVFGYEFRMPIEVAPYLRICDPLREIGGMATEVGVVRVGSAGVTGVPNVLACYAGRRWDGRAAETVLAGLAHCRRTDAGLMVLVLFADGALQDADAETVGSLRNLSQESPAPVLVAEDVGGRWATILGVDDTVEVAQWRLLDPRGVISWAPDTSFDADELSRVLEEALVVSAKPALVDLDLGPSVGGRLVLDIPTDGCPPAPLGRAPLRPSRVLFVDTGVSSSRTLDGLVLDGDDGEVVAIVVRDAAEREAAAVADRFGGHVPVVADPTGAVSRRAGVAWTPAVVHLDPAGRVADVVTEQGAPS